MCFASGFLQVNNMFDHAGWLFVGSLIQLSSLPNLPALPCFFPFDVLLLDTVTNTNAITKWENFTLFLTIIAHQ